MIKEIIYNASSKFSNLTLRELYTLRDSTYIIIDGGLNGRGDMRDYLSDLIDLIDNFRFHYDNVIVNKLDFDMLDDVFTIDLIVSNFVNE